MTLHNAAPVVLSSIADMRAWRKAQGSKSVGFVPTMGALHDGHAELLKRLRPNCERLVLSIFVNPTQFGPKEDLSKYPRTFERDLEIARREGVDAVFAPTNEMMYPPGYSTYVEEVELTEPLCGVFRPGHFRGVTTVVLKLFNIVQPHFAYFGLKDAQQFFVLKKMVKDLDLDIELTGIPTVRENDGLAMSSRNAYLSAEDRAKAPLIYANLREAVSTLKKGAPISIALEMARSSLERHGFKVQYLELLSTPALNAFAPPALRPFESRTEPEALLAVAAYLGTTRLIDNIWF